MERNLPYELSDLRSWVRNILLVMLVCEGAYFLHSGWLLQFIGEVESGVLSSEAISEKADRIDAVGAWVGWSYIAVNLICYIASGMWIYRASKNAGYLIPDQKRISPGWAVGWFFIPFANLFKPYQAMRQTYNSSVSPPRALDADMPGLFKWWWAAFVINNLAANISLQMARGEGLDSMRASTLVDLVNAPVSIAAILLWLKIVNTVTDEQKNNVDVFA